MLLKLFEELVLELKFWNCSSRTSTRTKFLELIVPELVLELKFLEV